MTYNVLSGTLSLYTTTTQHYAYFQQDTAYSLLCNYVQSASLWLLMLQMYLRELLHILLPHFYRHLEKVQDGLELLFCHRYLYPLLPFRFLLNLMRHDSVVKRLDSVMGSRSLMSAGT